MSGDDEQNGRGDLLSDESALLAALERRDAEPVDFEWLEVPRVVGPGGRPLRFRVRGLSPEESTACERRATNRIRRDGRWESELDPLKLMCETIIAATLPEDRQRLWGSARLREVRGVATERDLVLQLFNLKADLISAYTTVDALSDSSVRRVEAMKSRDH